MQKLKNILELIVFKHSIFALPFLLVSMLSAIKLYDLSFNDIWLKFILALLCAVSARNYAMALNRLLDADIDILNERTKNRPSVDGRVGRFNLALFIIANACIFVLLAYFINELCFYLSFFTLILLGSYSLFKRFSYLAHIILGLSLGFACVAGEIVLTNSVSSYSIALCFAVCFWTAGFDCLYALQDLEFDKNQELFSIPSCFGEKATLFIAAIFHLIAFLFWLVFLASVNAGFYAYLGLIIVGLMLILEHIIVRKNTKNIERAFFDINAFISILFLVFFIIDLKVS
ncbi:4-hydroxybenzoate octaprenyltransferase [Campylobacter sp. RM5004]|uniref:UbiA-like polyprenyltransferase n=1 Tax=Campylobacter sp. RM5004 TaxID=1660078 RepID=UPI001EFA9D18|nr:UbiA-like polyprenyltransferase [Campylobacter sp. RM5004]ULO02168.1 4-hydroxybenzoate octaprenyltransferase [Campylobacter sp. RM5004]